MSDTIFLCFYGDGPYWSDALYLPSLPSGVSYVHEFRYDRHLVDSNLASIDPALPLKKGGLVGAKVCLGTRFTTAGFEAAILAVREAEIIKVDFSPILYQFFFKLGPLFEFGEKHGALADHCTKIPAAEVGRLNRLLAFRLDVDVSRPQATGDENEYQAWANYADLVARDAASPFHPNARQGVFLRVRTPKSAAKGKPAKPQAIRRAAVSRDIFGYKLSKFKEFEIPIFYRVPFLMSRNTTPGDFLLEAKTPSPDLHLSTNTLAAVGNYGSVSLGITARGETSSVDVTISPPSQFAAQDGTPLYSKPLSIPVRGSYNLLSDLARRWLPNLILFLSFFVLGASGMFNQLLLPYLKGDISSSQIQDIYILLLFIAGGSAAATLAIQSLKSRG